MDKEEFISPSPKYRAKPFWAWNGNLKKEELLRQIQIFKTMGFGGFFMHSRTGLQTEYLGDEWFRLTNFCADEAEKAGIEAWLYDEDRWPSGTAGGMVTEDLDYRPQFLELTIYRPYAKAEDKELKKIENAEAVFVCDLKDGCFRNLKRTSGWREEENCFYRLVFQIVKAECKDMYNGYTYLDTMNRNAVNRFLQLTHEQYKKNCGDRLGRNIKGIFTDEPHRGPMFTVFADGRENRIPYTDHLFAEFLDRFGYDLKDALPYLFLREEGVPFSKVSVDYIELCQELFLENYAAPIQEWCKENHMCFTGHVLQEDSLSAQTIMQGSLMRFYEYMDIPGIDILTEYNVCWWAAKQAESVARQLGKPLYFRNCTEEPGGR